MKQVSKALDQRSHDRFTQVSRSAQDHFPTHPADCPPRVLGLTGQNHARAKGGTRMVVLVGKAKTAD
jgi:hypothetical protein